MAEEKKIIIEVVTNTVTQNNNNNNNNQPIPGSNKDAKQSHTSEVSTVKQIMKKVKSIDNTLNITSAINMGIERHLSLTENYIAQNDMNNLKTTWGKMSSLGKSVVTGALTGGWAGAITAAASWGTREYANYQQRIGGYYQALNATNYQTEFDRSRMGLTNEGKGTEN